MNFYDVLLAKKLGGSGGGGGDTPTGTKQITENGTYNVASYASAAVNVPASAVDSGTKNITENGNNQDVTGYAAVNVNVPNTYAAGDEGKVVSNGALVNQTSDSVTQNGTVDTTLIDSLTVNVSGGIDITDFSGGNILAIVANGTGYFETDYAVPLGMYGCKFKLGNAVQWEHFFGLASDNKGTGLQRYASTATKMRWATNGAYQDFTQEPDANGIYEIYLANQTLTSITANHPLLLFAGYYNGSIESQLSLITFYGLNIVNASGEFGARIVPWLDNGVACIKDLVSGTVYQNAGTGTFSYIDLQGVLHSA